MKKLLLGLGTSLLAVIPLTAVVSCSSSVTPTLDTEVAKFTTSKTTTPTTMSGSSAAKSINDASDATAKLTALNVFATVPTLAVGFTFEVKSAAVSTTKTSVDVKITVTETESKKTKEATLVVTGLQEQTALDVEVAKFEIPVVTKAPDANSTTAAAIITTAATAEEKLEFLKNLANLPTVSETFSITVIAATVATITTSINVSITITELANTANTTNVIFVVTGLVSLENEQAKLVEISLLLIDKKSLITDETAAMAATKITSSTLGNYYELIIMPVKFSYWFESATAGTGSNATKVNVVVTVSSEVPGTSPIEKIIVLSGFSPA